MQRPKPSTQHTIYAAWLLSFLTPTLSFANHSYPAFSYDGNLNFIYQQPNTAKIDSDTTLNAYLDLNLAFNSVNFTALLETATTAQKNGMSNVIPASNFDAGTALDGNGNARLQLSELFMTWQANLNSQLSFGVIDPLRHLDKNHLMNNENSQFIAYPLVNNPIIEFPSYAVAAFLNHRFNDQITARFLVASSHGLADNPKRDYAELFELNAPQKGTFIDSEISLTLQTTQATFGIWTNTAAHESLDDFTKTNLTNYGTYLNISHEITASHQLETRLAASNPQVSNGEFFGAIAYQYSQPKWTLGTAYAWTKISHYQTNPQAKHDNQLIEIYSRHQIFDSEHLKNLTLTPSIQYFDKPEYSSTNTQLEDHIWAFNLRMNYTF